MAAQINAGDSKRVDYFLVDPNEIVVEHRLNGRWQDHNEEAILKRVKSFEEEGQLQPVICRVLRSSVKAEDKRLQLVVGYCRHAAALLFNQLHPDAPMKLKVIVQTMNEEEALKKNVVENREREGTSVIDDAHCQRRFREEFGWNDTRIAQFYNVTPAHVCNLKKLLLLSSEEQMKVHTKELSAQAGMALASLSVEERKTILAPEEPPHREAAPAVTNEEAPPKKEEEVPSKSSKKPNLSQAVLQKVGDKKREKGGKQPRTLKQVKDFFMGLTGPAEEPRVKELSRLVLALIEGSISERTAEKRLNDMLAMETSMPHDC